jgi:hypothetical protein
LGVAAGGSAAIIAGGPQDQCIMQLLGMTAITIDLYAHGATQNAIMNCVFVVLNAYFGFMR